MTSAVFLLIDFVKMLQTTVPILLTDQKPVDSYLAGLAGTEITHTKYYSVTIHASYNLGSILCLSSLWLSKKTLKDWILLFRLSSILSISHLLGCWGKVRSWTRSDCEVILSQIKSNHRVITPSFASGRSKQHSSIRRWRISWILSSE